MGFYLSFADLLDKIPNKIGLAFIPVFVFTILAEAIVIQHRHAGYSWKSTGVSSLIAIGHILTQAAAHGLIFNVIAAGVYAVRLTTIPISWDNWPSLIALFLLTDLAFYIEHRCSHRIRL
jgi:sterol desaturase/sphingolipid hydroxylase (fatty acid hydroxylase superfamily)